MTLIEILNTYRTLTRTEGRSRARLFLDETGVDKALYPHIEGSVSDDGDFVSALDREPESEKGLFRATIEVLIEARDRDEAADVLSEALSENLLRDPRSGFKDWQYYYTHRVGPTEVTMEQALYDFQEFAAKLDENAKK